MKDKITNVLVKVALCGIIVSVIFGTVDSILHGLDIARVVVWFASVILTASIYVVILIKLFDFKNGDFFPKAIFYGIIMAIYSYIVYYIYQWVLFSYSYKIWIFITALVVVIRIIKKIFSKS